MENKLKEKILRKIKKREKELENFKIDIEKRRKKEDEKFDKNLNEDFKLKNILNLFYKRKAFKEDNSCGLLLGSIVIENNIKNEIKTLRELLK